MSHWRKTRSAYAAGFKLRVVEYAEIHGNSKAMRHFGVNEKLVRDWRKSKEKLADIPSTQLCLRGGKSSFPELEVELNEWILSQRQEGYIITRESIRLRAVELKETDKYKDLPGMDTFLASIGWVSRFMKRHASKQQTKIAQKSTSSGSSHTSLNSHMKTETEEKPSICQVCNKLFVDGSTRTNTGKKPFKCRSCQKTDIELKRKRSSYEAGFKLRVAEYAEIHGNANAMREFGVVNEKLVRDWRKAKETLADMPSTQHARFEKVTSFPELEVELNDWIISQRQHSYAITYDSIRRHANQLKKTKK